MDNDRIPQRVLYGELTEGKQNHGRRRLRFKDCIKADMVKCGLEEEDAKDRSRWRSATRKDTQKLKQDMIEELGGKRLRRNNAMAMAAPTDSTRHLCARPCKGNAKLQTHLQLGHRWPPSYQALVKLPRFINTSVIYQHFDSDQHMPFSIEAASNRN